MLVMQNFSLAACATDGWCPVGCVVSESQEVRLLRLLAGESLCCVFRHVFVGSAGLTGHVHACMSACVRAGSVCVFQICIMVLWGK